MVVRKVVHERTVVVREAASSGASTQRCLPAAPVTAPKAAWVKPPAKKTATVKQNAVAQEHSPKKATPTTEGDPVTAPADPATLPNPAEPAPPRGRTPRRRPTFRAG